MTRTERTSGRTAFHASASRSPKCELTQSAMNWLGMTISSSPESKSRLPSSAGLSQPSKVRAPRSRRRPARIASQAASSGDRPAPAETGSLPWHRLSRLPCTGVRLRNIMFAGRKSPTRATQVARQAVDFCPAPLPRRIRPRSGCFWEDANRVSSDEFFQREINRLDIKKSRKCKETPDYRRFLIVLAGAIRANR